ncbi:PAS domain-containing protein [Paracoccus thiocyanatus]|uniref:PAS sensor protein n=1 Tax=Paracoccus thiocyanatus TaxID=34006 RepID=A0A3D8PAW0_9RHOB|nr:PAS domain-containing protein [Paracoccus thiocyanatus]RDW12772.1 PAS sensor protein [Paracoccus thiocyanatus]
MTQIQRLHHDLEWAAQAMGSHRAVLVLDLAGHIVAVNDSYLGMCGYRRRELIGRPVAMLLDPSEKGPGQLSRMLDAPDGGPALLHGLVQLAKSGRRFRADGRICPVRDGEGQICLNVVFLRESAGSAGPPCLAGPAWAPVLRLPGPEAKAAWQDGWRNHRTAPWPWSGRAP